MEILYAFLIFYGGMFIGFLFTQWLHREKSYAGVIVVHKDAGKTLYSLEITGNIDDLDKNEQLLFKVVSPEESLNRE